MSDHRDDSRLTAGRRASGGPVGDQSAADHGSVAHRYEVRINGRLSHAILGYLGWSARKDDAHCHVLVETDPSGLAELLDRCSADGIVVDRVVRVQT